MGWIRARMKEASTHVSLAVGFQIAAIIFPTQALALHTLAGIFATTGFAIPEGPQ